ncbi:MAG TPA: MBL fold metallo-hydrolase [Bacteroidales bacterium]|nr:MBL fold metallo-hydrolase [Bacteroidales bacterium]
MIVHPLFSSSAGNATLIYNTASQILIDVGVSYKKLIAATSITIKPDAVLISHEHVDHVSGVGVLGRKTFSPVYVSKLCYDHKPDYFNGCDLQFISGGDVIETEGFKIEPFSTRHDSKASLGFVVTDKINGKKLGFLTDTGSFTKLMKLALVGCDGYVLETDYDDAMLEEYPDYDSYLKGRIAGPWGHLSNRQTMDFINEVIDINKVSWIVLGHLSVRTNSTEKVAEYVKQTFPNFINKFFCAPLETPLEL